MQPDLFDSLAAAPATSRGTGWPRRGSDSLSPMTPTTGGKRRTRHTPRELKEAGMQQAAVNAGPDWQERAMGYVREYIATHPQKRQVMGEDIRLFAEGLGLDKPPHKRAWGPVMIRAAKEALVRRIGSAQVNAPGSHQGYAALWEVL